MKSTAFFVCGVLGLVTAIICVPSLQAMLRRAVALSPLTINCPSIPTLHDLNKANYKGYMKAMAEYIDQTKKYDAAFLTLGTNQGRGRNPESKESERGNAVDSSSDIDVHPGLRLLEIWGGGAKLLFHPQKEQKFSKISVWNDTFVLPRYGPSDRQYVVPGENATHRPVDQVIQGNAVTFTGWYVGNFGHFLHDHLPIIAWLRENLDRDIKFLLLYHPRHEEILNTVDSTFVEERVQWVRRNEVVQVRGGILKVLQSERVRHRARSSVKSLGRWLKEAHPPQQLPEDQRSVVYYSRGGSGDTRHSRIVQPSHEADIISAIRNKMEQHGRTERLVIFTGQENGTTMAVNRQFDLFRSASTVIGPHGSGLANIVWMDPTTCSTECGAAPRPQVLEFLLGPDSTQVQSPHEPFVKTYYQLYATMPWVEYHHILYASNSTYKTTFVNLEALNMALDEMWVNPSKDDYGVSTEGNVHDPQNPTMNITAKGAVHFLHIGKAGGGTIDERIKFLGIPKVGCHPGPCPLRLQNPNLINIRDPTDRFLSDFYWQAGRIEYAQRVCRPQSHSARMSRLCKKADGSDGVQEMIHDRYQFRASALGEALCSLDDGIRSQAEADINSLEHAGTPLASWLGLSSPDEWKRSAKSGLLAAVVLEKGYDFANQIDSALDWLLTGRGFEAHVGGKSMTLRDALRLHQEQDGRMMHSSLEASGAHQQLTDMATCCVARHYKEDYRMLSGDLADLVCNGAEASNCRGAMKSILDRHMWALKDTKTPCKDVVRDAVDLWGPKKAME